MLVGALAACGSVANDATGSGAGTICDPGATFDAPAPVAGLNTADVEGVPRLTPDELELYFYFYASGNDGGTADPNLHRAQRTSVDQPFGAAIALPRVNTTAAEYDPSVSSDGLTLFFESNRVAGEGYHLYMSTRLSHAAEFETPAELANVNSASVTDTDEEPFVTADRQELWFASNRAGGLGNVDIYRAEWNGASFGNVVGVTSLSTSASDYYPTLSADKLTIYLSSTRPGGQGGYDIWTAHRSTTNDGFPPPKLVAELNSSGVEYVGWLSPDNCRIYFSSDRAGTFDIYVASRHPM